VVDVWQVLVPAGAKIVESAIPHALFAFEDNAAAHSRRSQYQNARVPKTPEGVSHIMI